MVESARLNLSILSITLMPMTQPSRMPAPDAAGGLPTLQEIVRRLRAPEGCPWDREQDHHSIRTALIEECYETIDAIENGDDRNLCEELGDLLLHVVMHAQMASERGAFSFIDVLQSINEKLIRRHPHVFGDAVAENAVAVLGRWEEIKKRERSHRGEAESVMSGLPRTLPALMRAEKAQKKAAHLGLDWQEMEGVFEKWDEEMAELQEALAAGDRSAIEQEMGDLLFHSVNIARKLKMEAEVALNKATDRFRDRVRMLETLAAEKGLPKLASQNLDELERLWQEAKARLAAKA